MKRATACVKMEASDASTDAKSLLEGLRSSRLIVRQKACRDLEAWASGSSAGAAPIADACRELLRITADAQSPWQTLHGAFLGSAAMVSAQRTDKSFRDALLKGTLAQLEHPEYRIRLVVADVLRALTKADGVAVYNASKSALFRSIHTNFQRQAKDSKIKGRSKFMLPQANLMALVDDDDDATASAAPPRVKRKRATREYDDDEGDGAQSSPQGRSSGGSTGRESTRIVHAMKQMRVDSNESSTRPSPHTATKTPAPSVTQRVSDPRDLVRWKSELREKMHDTEGWKSLETSFGALRAIISGAGASFSKHVDGFLLELLELASTHLNRFVREIAYHTTSEIAQSCDVETLRTLAQRTCTLLAKGLSDNWSQVRYASSIATRHMLTRAIKHGFAEAHLPLLLPPMCLNRYYVAQGVRIYSTATWRLAVGTRGAELVATHAKRFVDFYCKQALADNHAVREAACACIAELALKVDKKAVRPHVPTLLDALVGCFKDDSWPVRDAACSACGDFVCAFPDEARGTAARLQNLWMDHLRDSIPTVREGAAVALAKAARVYEDTMTRVVAELKKSLPMARKQPKDSKRMGGIENVTQFGVARRVSGAESLINSDRQMYSCGSLAPKLKRRGAGCMDHGFQRPAEPWEVTDGAIYLLREISSVRPELVAELIEVAIDVVRLRHYSHNVYLKETFWKAVPVIAKNMGKRPFKRILQPLLGPMVDTLLCSHRLAKHAAADCVEFLVKFVGKLIFTGRLTDDMKDKIRKSGVVRL